MKRPIKNVATMPSLIVRMRYWLLAMMLAAALLVTKSPLAEVIDATPDGLVKTLVSDVMTSIKADKDIQSGNVTKVMSLVEVKIVPYTNFQLSLIHI